MKKFTQLLSYLTKRRKRQFGFLLLLMLVSAFAEIVSLGAVLPFIAALTAPDEVLRYDFINWAARLFDINNGAELVLPLTVLFISIVVSSAIIRIVLARVSTRLAYSAGADLGLEIYKRTLLQPYQKHVLRNSSEVVAGVTQKVDNVITGVLLPALILLSTSILFCAILVAVFLINWKVALITGATFGAAYAIVTFIVRRIVKANGIVIAREQTRVLQSLREGLSGIRDVLLNNRQEHYVQLYRASDIPKRRAQGDNKFLAQFPRYALEAFGISIVALVALYWSAEDNFDVIILPTLAAIAMAGQRMLPALQQAYAAWASILGTASIFDDTLELLKQPIPKVTKRSQGPAVSFNDRIEFSNVTFKYESADSPTLEDADLVIPKGCRLGIVGETGSGKSTTIDILMGLLIPNDGALSVDGIELNENTTINWQRNISHVPQNVFLTDTSFAQNIAFGEVKEDIDLDRVKSSAEQAQISEFIERQPRAYWDMVGEDGVRISGGQRQRIGIARALYHNADVLVLDEATSALDTVTEDLVMSTISELNSELTIVMIAHRISTLRNCTKIVELKDGKIEEVGGYDDLLEKKAESKLTGG